MPTTTANLGLTLPTPNVDTGWGSTLNTDFTTIDNLFAAAGSGPSVGLNVGSGKTLNVGGTLVGAGAIILGSGDGTGTTVAPTIRGAARTGTNVAGPNLVIDACNGTGTGGSGSIIFRTAPAGSSGSVANTMQTVLEVKNDGTVQVAGGNLSPTGSVTAYAGASAPTGWLLCFGQSLSTTTYAALFAVIGYTYGGGGGSFNLPDLRGRAVAGKDDMGGASAGRLTSPINGAILGAAGGAQSHTLSTAEMPLHGHPWRSVYYNQSTTSSGSSGGFPVSSNGGTYGPYTGTPTNTQGQQIGGAGGGGAHNNVQPTFVLNYIIKT